MRDRLRMDHINSLPQPFLVKFGSRDNWWPVHDFEVQTGMMRIDVCGRLQPKHFSDVTHIRDGDSTDHDPDTFYNEEDE